jgi:pyruvate dehydrogenase E2 component (dihydrolipoamide acetyltransferase)
MAEVIRMPLLSDTMKEGVIAEWHKKVGDKVKSDDVLADVETDKATMEVMPFVSGTILYIGVEKGKAAKVNEIIAIIGNEGEEYASLLDNNTTTMATAAETETTPTITSDSASAIPEGVTVIRMPLLSDTMTEGKIVVWNKQVGDVVKSDDVLADVETDKATMEVMGYADGTLLHIGVPAGSAAKINEIIAIVGKPGTDIQSILQAPAAPSPAVAARTPALPQRLHPGRLPRGSQPFGLCTQKRTAALQGTRHLGGLSPLVGPRKRVHQVVNQTPVFMTQVKACHTRRS